MSPSNLGVYSLLPLLLIASPKALQTSAGAGPKTGAVPVVVCADAVTDQDGGGCMQASSTATSGLLFPYPGINNTFTAPALVASGFANMAGANSFVGGGNFNTASGHQATVGGGYHNTASGHQATVGGGYYNTASGFQATVAGGSFNTSGYQATVAGGFGNMASGSSSTVGGGYANIASGNLTTVGGGSRNDAQSLYATIAGGDNNTISGTGPGNTIGGGKDNTVSGSGYSVVAGGRNNAATRGYLAAYAGATVGGGANNQATTIATTVGGGDTNTASGINATVPGGASNVAQGNNSFAAGKRAKANHAGAFVWGDGFNGDKTSSAADQFNVYASGGTRIFSNSAATTGVLLAAGGSSWTMVSDRDAKENFEQVDGREVLERVSQLPISTWNYKEQDDSVRHMGPMAQDFWTAFGLGLGDKTIDTIDPNGVALAAIQGLDQKLADRLAEKDAEIAGLRQANEQLRAEFEALRTQLASAPE